MATWFSKPASFNKEIIWDVTSTGDMFYEIWKREDDGTERSVMGGSIPPSALTKNNTAQDILYSGVHIAKGHQGDAVSIPWSVLQKARYGNEYRILEGNQTNVTILATATTWSFRWTIQKLNPSTQQYEFDHYENYTSDPFSQNTGVGSIARGGFFNYMGMSRSWSGYQLGSGIRVWYNIIKDDGTTDRIGDYFNYNSMPIAPVVNNFNLVKTEPQFKPVTEEIEYTLYYDKVTSLIQSTTVTKPIVLSYDNYNNSNSYQVKIGNNTIYTGRLYWTKGNDIKLTINDLANQNIHFNNNIFDKYNDSNVILNYYLPKLDTYVNDNMVGESTFYIDYRGANSYDNFDRTDFIRDEVEPWQYIFFTALNTAQVEAYTDINGERYWIPALSQETFKIKAEGYDAISVYNKTLTVNKCSKAKAVVYYLNSRCGWNFISATNVIEKENYTKNQFTSGKIQTTENTNWANIYYNTEVKKQFTVSFSNLDDRQSKIVHEIYSSPFIYIHFKSGDIYACNCTDKTSQVKTFQNQSKKHWKYDVNLEVSSVINRMP